jgi:hypothetical protein
MGKSQQWKGKSQRGKGGRSDKRKSKLTLKFQRPKLDSSKIKIKFKDADGEEVEEYSHTFTDGDYSANIIQLYLKFVEFGKTYGWGEKLSKKLCQNFARSLEGQCKTDWIDIMDKIREWKNVDEDKLSAMFQEHALTVFGKKAGDAQYDAMLAGNLQFPSNSPIEDNAKRYFEINEQMIYLGKGTERFSVKQINKQFQKVLPAEARKLFKTQGGHEAKTKKDILEICGDIDEILDIEQEVHEEKSASKRNDRNDRNDHDDRNDRNDRNQQSGEGDDKNDSEKSGQFKNRCGIHKNHEWKDCPDNPHSKNYKGNRGNDGSKGKGKGELQSVEQRKDRVVRFEKNEDTLDSDDDDVSYEDEVAARGELMTLSQTKMQAKVDARQDRHPTTIIAIPVAPGSTEMVATKCLIDTCCTGLGIIHEDLAEIFSHKISKISSSEDNEYITGGGSFVTNSQIEIEGAMLPVLSMHRSFNATLQVGRHHANYGLIIGQKLMRQIQLNTDILEGRITWGKEDQISVPMPPRNYWTRRRIRSQIKRFTKRNEIADQESMPGSPSLESKCSSVDSSSNDSTPDEAQVQLDDIVETKIKSSRSLDETSIVGSMLSFAGNRNEDTSEDTNKDTDPRSDKDASHNSSLQLADTPDDEESSPGKSTQEESKSGSIETSSKTNAEVSKANANQANGEFQIQAATQKSILPTSLTPSKPADLYPDGNKNSLGAKLLYDGSPSKMTDDPSHLTSLVEVPPAAKQESTSLDWSHKEDSMPTVDGRRIQDEGLMTLFDSEHFDSNVNAMEYTKHLSHRYKIGDNVDYKAHKWRLTNPFPRPLTQHGTN